LQMYLALPVFWLVSRKVPCTRFLLAMSVLFLLTLVIGYLQPTMSYMSRLTIFRFAPNFLPGVIAFFVFTRFPKVIPSMFWIASIAILSIVYAFYPNDPVGWTLCLILGAAITLFKQMEPSSLTRAAAVIAKYSYGIYLAHLFCIHLGFRALIEFPVWIQWGAFFVSMIVVPPVLYHFVEEPMIRIGKRVAQSGPLQVRAAEA
jgi:peptidoglycan/LPS O-acetylase OafA/YrhL